jgi:putative transposase
MISASCFEHRAIIGHSTQRMTSFAESLLQTLDDAAEETWAWVVLPNHYHVLVVSKSILELLKALGKLHGKSSFAWNGEENSRGRKVWFNAAETVMKSNAHTAATMNYIHHNPVKHGYAEKWTDWPWSSAQEYLNDVGRGTALEHWNTCPVDQYGDGWDDASL